MLQEVLLLLLLAAMVVISTVRKRRFVRSRNGLDRDGRVALLLRWGSIAAGRWVHGLVCLGGT